MGKRGPMTGALVRSGHNRGLVRRRPRSFTEWSVLRRWEKLPAWEVDVPGFLLREARQGAGLTQGRLAGILGISQQAVSRAEQWSSNPTVALMRRWLGVCGWRLELRIEPVEAASKLRR